MVERLVFGAYYQSGQSCISVQRIYVHRDIHDALRKKLRAKVKSLAMGDPRAETTFIGPMIDEDAAKRLENWIDDARKSGAKVLAGGPRAGNLLRGPDIVVAAEKTGLTYGHMNVFHRLVDNHPERGPIFSVANIRSPGSFEMAEIQTLETPAIAFFLTLPAPVRALDAWDAMLPTAERMAELLDGVLLDEQRNALGRQRIAGLRDELRSWDREHEVPPVTRSPRW